MNKDFGSYLVEFVEKTLNSSKHKDSVHRDIMTGACLKELLVDGDFESEPGMRRVVLKTCLKVKKEFE